MIDLTYNQVVILFAIGILTQVSLATYIIVQYYRHKDSEPITKEISS